jgi:hypothetical protein
MSPQETKAQKVSHGLRRWPTRPLIALISPLLLLRGSNFFLPNTEQPPREKSKHGPMTQSIKPGNGIDDLKLGESRERALELFSPKRGIDQESSEPGGCGSSLNWVDVKNRPVGNVFLHFKDDRLFQIDSATTRFHTREGITVLSSPQRVHHYYKKLKAFILSAGFSEATGGRPLVYWVDTEGGIAFSFAYSKTTHSRYLYSITVFQPNADICPFVEPLGDSDKRELPPYSLEPE